MKTRIILAAMLLCIAFTKCNKPNDCSEEAENNYGRPVRTPTLYNTEYMTLSDFINQYWQVADGDTLRLKGYLVHTFSEQYNYHLDLCKTPADTIINRKSVASYFYSSGGYALPISKKDGLPNTYGSCNVGSSVPYMDDTCYDTLKNKLVEIEGIVHFTYHGSQVFCEEGLCYLYVADWDSQLNNILNQ